jgi:hypothetical protein
VRDMVEEKKVLLEKVDTLKNVADSWTKSVLSICSLRTSVPFQKPQRPVEISSMYS